MSEFAFVKAVFRREYVIAMRHKSGWVNALLFYLMMLFIFPFMLEENPAIIPHVAAGIIWVGVLFANVLSLERLFKIDYQDGSFAQIKLSRQSIFSFITIKLLLHWCLTALPLILLTPLFGLTFHMSISMVKTVMLTLLVGTPALTLFSALMATVTIKINQSGLISGLLLFPLTLPVLLFAVASTETPLAHLHAAIYFLCALTLFSIATLPWMMTKMLSSVFS